MNLPLPLLIVVSLAWVFSVAIIFSLWKSEESFWFKIVGSIAAALPVFGPFLYHFIKMPPRLPTHLRATMNHHGRGGRFIGFGSERFNYDPVVDQTWSKTPDKTEVQRQRHTRRSLTGWEKVGLAVAFVFLLIYWEKALHYLTAGDAWGHSNYWGHPVGTYLLIAVLLTGSVAFISIVWRFWISRYFQKLSHPMPRAPASPTSVQHGRAASGAPVNDKR